MKNKLFDDFVNEKFGDYRPNVPPHIWENIVVKKGDKKPIGFLLFGTTAKRVAAVLFVLLATSTLVYLFSHKNNINTKENISSITKNNVDSTAYTTNTNGEKITKNEIAAESNTLKADNFLADENKKNVQKSIIADEELAAQKLAQQNGNKMKNTVGKNDTEIIENFKKRHTTFPNRTVVKITAHSEVESNKEVTEAINYNITQQRYLHPSDISSLSLLESSRLFNTKLIVPHFPKIPTIPCPEAERNTAGNKQYIDVYGGPDFIYRSYTDTADSEYLKNRKASTGINYAYSVGLRYTKVFNNGVSVRTGINYSQINENFIAKKGFVLQNVYVVNNLGDTINSYINRTLQYERSTNIYKTMDIPLMIGYELGNGRLHTNLSAGVMVNVLSKQRGNVLDKNGNAVDITSGKSNSIYQYKSNVGVAVLGAVSVFYKLNKNLHLMAEPYFRYSLSSFTKPDITLKQKTNTVGIRFGLRLDL
jgi:hypothetical protein